MGHAAVAYRVAGVEQANVVIDKRTAVGPNPYVADTGIAVNLSAIASALHSVRLLRAYVTSSGAADTRTWKLHEAGTDTFANRKFRILAFRAALPTTNTDGTVVKATSVAEIDQVLFGGTLTGSCGAVGCDTDHPNGSGFVNDVLQAPGAAQISVVTGLVAPSVADVELTSGDLSGITLEFEAVYTPA